MHSTAKKVTAKLKSMESYQTNSTSKENSIHLKTLEVLVLKKIVWNSSDIWFYKMNGWNRSMPLFVPFKVKV